MITVNVKYADLSKHIEFPCSEESLDKALSELRVPDEERIAPKLLVDEVVNYDDLKGIEGKLVNLDELNYLAKRIESFDSKERTKFNAVVSMTKMRTMPDLINLTFNEQYYTLIRDVSNPERVGREHFMARNGGMTEKDALEYDFAKIGKEVIESGKGKLTAYGLLITNDDLPYETPYNGKNFPAYYYEPKMVGVSLEYNGNNEYVYLPDSPIAIQKAIKRLDAETIGDCTAKIDYLEPTEVAPLLRSVIENEGIYAANDLAYKLDKVSKYYFDKLTAVVEYAGVEDAENIGKIAENIDKFEFIPDAECDEDVAEYMIDHTDEFYVCIELTDYLDMEQFGKDLMEERNGSRVNGGVIMMKPGYTLDQIIRVNEEQGMTMDGM